MKLTEKILIALAALLAILKFLIVPGSGIFMVLVFCLLSSLYFYCGFALFNNIRLRLIFKKDSYKEISTGRIIGGIALGLSLSFSIIGFLFIAQHWPGASFHLIISISSGIVILIISLIKFFKTKASYYKNALRRISVSTTISIILFVVPVKYFIEIKYRNHPKYIEAYNLWIENPNDPEIENKWIIEYNRISMNEKEFKYFMENEYHDLKVPDDK
jgi:hypothetical protein